MQATFAAFAAVVALAFGADGLAPNPAAARGGAETETQKIDIDECIPLGSYQL